MNSLPCINCQMKFVMNSLHWITCDVLISFPTSYHMRLLYTLLMCIVHCTGVQTDFCNVFMVFSQKMSRDGDEHPRDPPKCVCLCARKTGKENQISKWRGGKEIKLRSEYTPLYTYKYKIGIVSNNYEMNVPEWLFYNSQWKSLGAPGSVVGRKESARFPPAVPAALNLVVQVGEFR